MSANPAELTLEWALYYASRGWQVFPVHSIVDGQCTCGKDCSSAGKHPLTAHGHNDATDDEEQIRAWWRAHPYANIGIATGSVSNLWVADIDLRDNGVANWETFCGGRAAETLTQRTGSGGGQKCFAWNSDLEVRCRTDVLPGIDVRGDGGYVVVPPSLHRSGNRYEWLSDPATTEVAFAPDWVMELVMGDRSPGAPVPNLPASISALSAPEIASIKSALASIPADCDCDKWIRIGMALHSTDAGEQVFRVWDEWSSTGTSKYPGEPELRRQWASFAKKDNEVRLASIFHFAKEHGWGGQFEELVDGKVLAMVPGAMGTQPSGPSFVLSGPSWPTIDVDKLYGLAGDFVRMVVPHTDADPAALHFSFLAALGVILGRKLHFRVGATKSYLNLFVAVIGKTARARKGTSLGWVEALLELAAPEFQKHNTKSGVVSGEGLIEAVHDPIIVAEPLRKKGTREVTGYQDVIADKGVADKRLLVVEPEFARVLAVCSREGNTLAPVLRDLFDGRDLRSMGRKLNNLTATNPHGGIIAHCTIEEFRSTLRPEDLHGGTVNRFLFVCARRTRKLPVPKRPPDGEWKAFAERVRMTIARATSFTSLEASGALKESEELALDEEATALWTALYDDLTKESGGQFDAATARSDALALRLAALLAALDCSPFIQRAHVAAAYDLWRYASASAAVLFPIGAPIESAEERQRRELVTWIDGRQHHQSTARDLARNGATAYRAAGTAETALMDLAGRGMGWWVDVRGSRALRVRVDTVAPEGDPSDGASDGFDYDQAADDTLDEGVAPERPDYPPCDTTPKTLGKIDEASRVATSHAENTRVCDDPTPAAAPASTAVSDATADGTDNLSVESSSAKSTVAVPSVTSPKILNGSELMSHVEASHAGELRCDDLLESDATSKGPSGHDAIDLSRDGQRDAHNPSQLLATCDATPEITEENDEVSQTDATPAADGATARSTSRAAKSRSKRKTTGRVKASAATPRVSAVLGARRDATPEILAKSEQVSQTHATPTPKRRTTRSHGRHPSDAFDDDHGHRGGTASDGGAR